MVSLEPGLYLVVSEQGGPSAPLPRPLASGFSAGIAYRALGVFSPSETSEAYFILSNDRDEVWFISNRHLRTHALLPTATALRLPLAAPPPDAGAPLDGHPLAAAPAHDPAGATR